VLVIPEYENPDDKLSSPFTPGPNDGEKDWVWFSTMNRVNTQVLKVRSLPLSLLLASRCRPHADLRVGQTLVLCYVSIPPLARMQLQSLSSPEAFVQGLKRGDTYSVREVTIRRWTPARMRA
jgi:tRNA-splicing endonuclease subunit Sen2